MNSGESQNTVRINKQIGKPGEEFLLGRDSEIGRLAGVGEIFRTGFLNVWQKLRSACLSALVGLGLINSCDYYGIVIKTGLAETNQDISDQNLEGLIVVAKSVLKPAVVAPLRRVLYNSGNGDRK
jgi:hypothetical protein